MAYNETPQLKGIIMNKQTAVLTAIFALGAVAGFLSKSLEADDKIAVLQNDLKKAKFKARINRVAFEAALGEVPSGRGPAISEAIDNAMKFEQIVAQLED